MGTLDNLNPGQLEIKKNIASRKGNALTYFEICKRLGETPRSENPPEFPRLYWEGQSEKEAEKTLAEYGAIYDLGNEPVLDSDEKETISNALAKLKSNGLSIDECPNKVRSLLRIFGFNKIFLDGEQMFLKNASGEDLRRYCELNF